MKCCIVKDLLPGYIDGLTSEETNMEIKEHLENCAACRTIYEQMSAELPSEIPREEKDIDSCQRHFCMIRTSTNARYISTARS